MSQFVETNIRQDVAAGSIAIHARVKTPGALAAAGISDPDIGTIEVAALAANDVVRIRLRSAAGTAKMISTGSITVGDTVYAAASGKISATANLYPVGIAMETVTTDGDIVEVARNAWFGALPRFTEDHTSGDTLTTAESGSTHTNTGATGIITIILPAAVVGLEYFFYIGAAFRLQIDPDASEKISLPSSGVPGTGGKWLWADLAGESVHLMCTEDGTWAVMGFTGTWTAET